MPHGKPDEVKAELIQLRDNDQGVSIRTWTSDRTHFVPGQMGGYPWYPAVPSPYSPPYQPRPLPFAPQPYQERVYIYPQLDTLALKTAIDNLTKELETIKQQTKGATEKEKVALDLLLNHDPNDTEGLQRVLKAVKLLLDK
jgi:hypothetical protein